MNKKDKKLYTARQLSEMLRIAMSLDSYGRLEFLNLHGMAVWEAFDKLVKEKK